MRRKPKTPTADSILRERRDAIAVTVVLVVIALIAAASSYWPW